MKRAQGKIAVLLASREGATAIEYGLIAALIALGGMFGIQAFGISLADMWTYVADTVLANA